MGSMPRRQALVWTRGVEEKVWIYPPSKQEPARKVVLSTMRVKDMLREFCGAPIGKDFGYRSITTNFGIPMVILGRMTGDECEKSEWVKRMYGYIFVSAGERDDEDGDFKVYETNESVVRAYMERMIWAR